MKVETVYRGEGSGENVALPTVLISVVVPVRNEAAFIAGTLDQLLDQDLDEIDLEIFVVDGQSTDSTREIVGRYTKKYPIIRLLENPKRLSSAARNLAIKHMQGEYLVVVDGHCEIPSRRYFQDLSDAFETSGADSLGRPQPLDVAGATPLQRAIAVARSSPLGHHPESFIYSDEPRLVPAKSVAVAYRREVFDKVGFFDETFDAHEDGEFNLRCDRAGLRCYFVPQLAVKYFPRSSLSGLFQQMVRYGRGRVRLARKHTGMWGLGVLVPAMFVVYLVLGAIASLLMPQAWIFYAFGLALYAIALFANGAASAIQQQDVGLIFRVPVVLATVHLGAGWGVLRELAVPVSASTAEADNNQHQKWVTRER